MRCERAYLWRKMGSGYDDKDDFCCWEIAHREVDDGRDFEWLMPHKTYLIS